MAKKPLNKQLVKALADGLVELYEFSPANERVYSGKGIFPYLEFLKLEQKRIKREPGRVARVIRGNGGQAALFVNPIRTVTSQK